MCLICTAFNIPACVGASCNPIVIYEGASLTASNPQIFLHITMGAISTYAVAVLFFFSPKKNEKNSTKEKNKDPQPKELS